MSDVMLLGVLRMPPELWGKGAIDVAQRHWYYKAAADRIEQDAARIRKLVEAAEWRDECLEAKEWCEWMKVAEWTPGGCKRWEKSYDHSIKILESAEAAYQAALEASKKCL